MFVLYKHSLRCVFFCVCFETVTNSTLLTTATQKYSTQAHSPSNITSLTNRYETNKPIYVLKT